MTTTDDAYCTKEELKAYLGIEHASQDEALTVAINAASRAIDHYCQRRFYTTSSASARTYYAHDANAVKVDDLWSTGSLTVYTDSADNGTYDQAWTRSTDYTLEPANGVRAGLEGWPYTDLIAVGTRRFPCSGRRRRVQVTALWGWESVPALVKDACLIWASRLYKRSNSPEGITAGGFDLSPVRVSARIDPDVEQLLAPYRQPIA